MRKILALILSLAVCFSMVSMIGCGDTGNYQPVSAQELSQIAESMEENQTEGPIAVVGDGYQLTMKMTEGPAFSMDMDVKVAKVGETYQFAAIVDSGAGGIIKTYYKDNYLYSYANYEGDTFRVKAPYALDDALTELPDMSAGLKDLGDVIGEMSIYGNAFKCYVDRTGENLKAKVEVKLSESGYTINMVIIYELDANYRLVSYSADMDMMGMTIKANLSPFNGTITFPSDLDSYEFVS